MRTRFQKIVTIAILAGGFLLCPSLGLAQDNGDTGPDLKYPRNMVKGGAVSSRAPGNWVNQGLAKHVEFQQRALKNFGGATPQPAEDQDPSPKQVFLTSFIEGAFDVLNELAQQLVLALQASQALTTTQ